MNTWQTVYKQLQEILNKCIELWWNPSEYSNSVKCIDWWVTYNEWWDYDCYMPYHVLFSKDSGIMEYVEWKPSKNIESITINEPWWFKYDVKRSPYYEMSDMTAQEKVQYFISNAIVWNRQ